MKSLKAQLLVVLAAGVLLAVAVAGAAVWGGDVLLLILLVATLVITYALRRYARSELIYGRRPPVETPQDRAASSAGSRRSS